MNQIDKVRDIVENFEFTKGDYQGAEEQLYDFAECYAQLSIDEADELRCSFDARQRHSWLRVASTLFTKEFDEADMLRKDRLCKIFFALYSFDNLEFGYDSVMDIISISDQMKGHVEMAQKNWVIFSKITTRDTARNNLENKLFTS